MDDQQLMGPPASELTITDLDRLRVIADPLRLRILETLIEPRTVKQVAAALGLAPTKLYYHINLLERHGLIVVVDTRLVSGILEKRYQAAARGFRVDHDLLALSGPAGDAGLDMFLAAILGRAGADIKRGVHNGTIDVGQHAPHPDALFLTHVLGRLAPEQLAEFYARLDALVRELDGTRSGQADLTARPYALALALYPTDAQDPDAGAER
jgi:DNA-binding transcriptional ArsR family regulator